MIGTKLKRRSFEIFMMIKFDLLNYNQRNAMNFNLIWDIINISHKLFNQLLLKNYKLRLKDDINHLIFYLFHFLSTR